MFCNSIAVSNLHHNFHQNIICLPRRRKPSAAKHDDTTAAVTLLTLSNDSSDSSLSMALPVNRIVQIVSTRADPAQNTCAGGAQRTHCYRQ